MQKGTIVAGQRLGEKRDRVLLWLDMNTHMINRVVTRACASALGCVLRATGCIKLDAVRKGIVYEPAHSTNVGELSGQGSQGPVVLMAMSPMHEKFKMNGKKTFQKRKRDKLVMLCALHVDRLCMRTVMVRTRSTTNL